MDIRHINQSTGTNRKVNISYSKTAKTTFFIEVTCIFQHGLIDQREYYFFPPIACVGERHLLCHANWSGVKRDLNVEKLFKHRTPGDRYYQALKYFS